ncbi:hypothetical protein [Nostoc sp. DSM 114159]
MHTYLAVLLVSDHTISHHQPTTGTKPYTYTILIVSANLQKCDRIAGDPLLHL